MSTYSSRSGLEKPGASTPPPASVRLVGQDRGAFARSAWSSADLLVSGRAGRSRRFPSWKSTASSSALFGPVQFDGLSQNQQAGTDEIGLEEDLNPVGEVAHPVSTAECGGDIE